MKNISRPPFPSGRASGIFRLTAREDFSFARKSGLLCLNGELSAFGSRLGEKPGRRHFCGDSSPFVNLSRI
ncbi:MAG TPA: hypothetical protein DDX91_08690 [Ruminococcaceae bacterium]|nr:hypothetical protein [Oscillospiraceae bacterium]